MTVSHNSVPLEGCKADWSDRWTQSENGIKAISSCSSDCFYCPSPTSESTALPWAEPFARVLPLKKS